MTTLADQRPDPDAKPPRRPSFTTDDAERSAAFFGLSGTVTELHSDRDRAYVLQASDGRKAVLKIALTADVARSGLEAQHAALEHVAAQDPNLSLPAPLAGPGGERLAKLSDRQDRPCLMQALSFVPGQPLPDTGLNGPELRGQWGALAARVRTALRDFHHHGVRADKPWNLLQAPQSVRERIELLPADRRSTVVAVLRDHEDAVAPLLSLLPRQVVHNDLNDHNLIVPDRSGEPEDASSGQAAPSLGVIDFGDITESVGIAELAVAGAYAMLDTARPVHALAELARGYAAIRPLDPLEIEVLLSLARLRLALSVSMSADQARREPDNPYLRVSETGAWNVLDYLDVVDHRAAAREIARALGVEGPRPSRPVVRPSTEVLRDARARLLGSGLSLSLPPGLEMVRGRGQYLFDRRGRPYLDLVNNVAHVGHCHPRVVEALARQSDVLNTNSRYLHRLRSEYAERLGATMPSGLDVCWFVCSGTEANELALRIARAATGRRDVVVLDGAYHGNSSAMIDLSPYKHGGPGGSGPPDWVHVAPSPDPYRGLFRDSADAGSRYAEAVDEALAAAEARGGAAALFAEALPGCGGQIVPPAGFLVQAFRYARSRGACAVADEVQTGFGRVGPAFWAFASDGAEDMEAVVPDIVTLGKPIGNGHPLGAVVCTRELADGFDTGMEYFNTFGGNPVSCAVGLAVLDVLTDEALPDSAAVVGQAFAAGLHTLEIRHDCIGDVRGRGLFLGVELVSDPESRIPDGDLARDVVEAMGSEGILISRDGPDHNVLKIKPPLCITREDATRVVDVLDGVLRKLR